MGWLFNNNAFAENVFRDTVSGEKTASVKWDVSGEWTASAEWSASV